MKKYLLYITCFFLAVFIADLVVGQACEYLSSHAKGGDTQSHFQITRQQKAPVIIMGSSRAVHHYIPKHMEDSLGVEVYNCGVDGNGILFQYGRLSMILKRYTPKVIIYDAVPSFDISTTSDIAKDLKWLKRWYGEAVLDTLIRDISPTERLKLRSNLYKYNGAIFQMLSDNIRPQQDVQYHGYKPIYETMEYYTPSGTDSIVDWHPLRKKYFEKFIRLCHDNNIALVVVFSPWYGKQSSLPYTHLTDLCNKENIQIIDFYGGSPLNDRKDLFADVSHLNDEGATIFTDSIINILRKNSRMSSLFSK